MTYNHLYYNTCSCAAVWWQSDCRTCSRPSGTQGNLSSCAPGGTLLQTAEPFNSRNKHTSRARLCFYVHSVCKLTGQCRCMSVLTHAVFQCKGGSENGSELLGVSCQNNLTRLCIEQPFVPQITKINQHIKQVQCKWRKNSLFSYLPVGLNIQSPQRVPPRPQTHEWNDHRECLLWPACRDQRGHTLPVTWVYLHSWLLVFQMAENNMVWIL